MQQLAFQDPDPTEADLVRLRAHLDLVFSPDTRVPGTTSSHPSAGHCAAVAVIIQERFGGEFISTYVDGESHWFNRLRINDQEVDVDLTGDQFQRPPVQVAAPSQLYPGTRLRRLDEVNEETLARAALLRTRLSEVERQE